MRKLILVAFVVTSAVLCYEECKEAFDYRGTKYCLNHYINQDCRPGHGKTQTDPDAECAPCAAGSFNFFDSMQDQCLQCPKGSYIDFTGSDSCTMCGDDGSATTDTSGENMGTSCNSKSKYLTENLGISTITVDIVVRGPDMCNGGIRDLFMGLSQVAPFDGHFTQCSYGPALDNQNVNSMSLEVTLPARFGMEVADILAVAQTYVPVVRAYQDLGQYYIPLLFREVEMELGWTGLNFDREFDVANLIQKFELLSVDYELKLNSLPKDGPVVSKEIRYRPFIYKVKYETAVVPDCEDNTDRSNLRSYIEMDLLGFIPDIGDNFKDDRTFVGCKNIYDEALNRIAVLVAFILKYDVNNELYASNYKDAFVSSDRSVTLTKMEVKDTKSCTGNEGFDGKGFDFDGSGGTMKAVVRDEYFSWDPDSGILIYTDSDSLIDSNEKVDVWLYDDDNQYAGGVTIVFTSPIQYAIGGCMSYPLFDFSGTLPKQPEKTWRIVYHPDDLTLIIYCNEVEVANVVLSDDLCTGSSEWRDYWGKISTQIKFHFFHDTASDKYRVAQKDSDYEVGQCVTCNGNAGFYSRAGQCTPCPSTTYGHTDSENLGVCLNCPPSSHTPSRGMAGLESCIAVSDDDHSEDLYWLREPSGSVPFDMLIHPVIDMCPIYNKKDALDEECKVTFPTANFAEHTLEDILDKLFGDDGWQYLEEYGLQWIICAISATAPAAYHDLKCEDRSDDETWDDIWAILMTGDFDEGLHGVVCHVGGKFIYLDGKETSGDCATLDQKTSSEWIADIPIKIPGAELDIRSSWLLDVLTSLADLPNMRFGLFSDAGEEMLEILGISDLNKFTGWKIADQLKDVVLSSPRAFEMKDYEFAPTYDASSFYCTDESGNVGRDQVKRRCDEESMCNGGNCKVTGVSDMDTADIKCDYDECNNCDVSAYWRGDTSVDCVECDFPRYSPTLEYVLDTVYDDKVSARYRCKVDYIYWMSVTDQKCPKATCWDYKSHMTTRITYFNQLLDEAPCVPDPCPWNTGMLANSRRIRDDVNPNFIEFEDGSCRSPAAEYVCDENYSPSRPGRIIGHCKHTVDPNSDPKNPSNPIITIDFNANSECLAKCTFEDDITAAVKVSEWQDENHGGAYVAYYSCKDGYYLGHNPENKDQDGGNDEFYNRKQPFAYCAKEDTKLVAMYPVCKPYDTCTFPEELNGGYKEKEEGDGYMKYAYYHCPEGMRQESSIVSCSYEDPSMVDKGTLPTCHNMWDGDCDYPDYILGGRKVQEEGDGALYECYPGFAMHPNMDILKHNKNSAGNPSKAFEKSQGIAACDRNNGWKGFPRCVPLREAHNCGLPHISLEHNIKAVEFVWAEHDDGDEKDPMKMPMTMPHSARYECLRRDMYMMETFKGEGWGWCRKDNSMELPRCVEAGWWKPGFKLHPGSTRKLIKDGRVTGGIVLVETVDGSGGRGDCALGCDDQFNDNAASSICMDRGFVSGKQIRLKKKMFDGLKEECKHFAWTRVHCDYPDAHIMGRNCDAMPYIEALENLGPEATCFDFDTIAVECYDTPSPFNVEMEVVIKKESILCGAVAFKENHRINLEEHEVRVSLSIDGTERVIPEDDVRYKKKGFIIAMSLAEEEYDCVECTLSVVSPTDPAQWVVLSSKSSCEEEEEEEEEEDGG